MRSILLNIYLLAASSLILTSCIETIEPDLDEFTPQLTIEALVTDLGTAQYVILRKTGNFYSNEPQAFVADATVILSDNADNTDTLQHIGKGRYETTVIEGVAGRTYTLLVETEGQTYTSTQDMLRVTSIDSIYTTYYDKADFLHEQGYYISFTAVEPQDTKDFYLWKFYKNGELQNNYSDLHFSSDEAVGEAINGIEGPYVYAYGDSVKVEMYSLTESAYQFYMGLNNNLNNDGGFFSTPPANPASNFDQDVLGLFQVSSVEVKEIIVK